MFKYRISYLGFDLFAGSQAGDLPEDLPAKKSLISTKIRPSRSVLYDVGVDVNLIAGRCNKMKTQLYYLHTLNKNAMKKQEKSIQEFLIRLAIEWGVSPEGIEKMIDKITEFEKRGARFARITKYQSDASDNTEEASHTIILNVNYGNMLEQEKEALANFDITTANVDGFNYSNIDYASQGYTLEAFKVAVKAALATALNEMVAPKKKKDTSADIWLNNVMVLNTNTCRMSIIGQAVSKSVTEEGEFKQVASKPLTIAKKIIRMQAGCRTDKYRRFALDNFFGSINMQGETIEMS